jgi:hypothetical protein
MEELAENGVRSSAPKEQLTIHSGEILPSQPENQTKRLAAKKPTRSKARR